MYPDNLHIVEGGGIFLRPILIALSILLIAYIVKTDMSAGTLSHAATYSSVKEEEACIDKVYYNSVTVQIHEGDTLQTLFALHPSPAEMTFLERLALFYELNPHLRKQPLLPGDTVKLPILQEQSNACD